MEFAVAADGTATYTTVDGDALDLIAFNYFGTHDLSTQRVLAANPGLAELGIIYPVGIVIKLPPREVAQKAPVSQRSLWD